MGAGCPVHFRHFLEKPWFVRLLRSRNLHQARFLKTVEDIRTLHSPLVEEIQRTPGRAAPGAAGSGRGRSGAALHLDRGAGSLLRLQHHTLSTIFGRI